MSHILDYNPKLEVNELPFEGTSISKLIDMPKIDLHRHLVGAIRPEVLVYIADKIGVTLPTFGNDAERIKKASTFSTPVKDGYKHFLAKRIWSVFQHIFSDERGIRNAIYWASADAARDGVSYVEFRVSPYGIQYNHLLPHGVYEKYSYPITLHTFVDSLKKGIVAAERDYPQTTVKIILSLGRRSVIEKWENSERSRYYDRLITVAKAFKEIIVGFDLSGDEDKYRNSLFVEFADRVKENGFPLTIHAGETGNPESVREAIDLLKADRIGHGIGAIADKSLMNLLAQKGIPLEICPTSNLMLGLVRDLKEHPLREFLAENIPITVNTDDPVLLGPTTLSVEFYRLLTAKQIIFSNIQKISNFSIKASFASDSEKNKLLSMIENFFFENLSVAAAA